MKPPNVEAPLVQCPKLLRQAAETVHNEESGQVTFLFVFASVALILLFGFILGTARQTSRKVEMQGASDSAAVAGATWMARGMNMMVFNNKGMADLLAVMIAVHSAEQTASAMPKILAPIIEGLYEAAAAAFEAPPVAAALVEIAEALTKEAIAWEQVANELSPIDQQLTSSGSGKGWELMRALDHVNQLIKGKVPKLALAEAWSYASQNGAESAWLYGWQSAPGFPVARGRKEELATQAQKCALKQLRAPTILALITWCSLSNGIPCILSGGLAWLVFDQATSQNVSALSGSGVQSAKQRIRLTDITRMRDHTGKSIQQTIDDFNQGHDPNDTNFRPVTINRFLSSVATFILGKPLGWPTDSPYPMVLTDAPQPQPDARVADESAEVDLWQVRKYLQFLALARASIAPEQEAAIGGRHFINPAPYGWVTYGEADVYNPTNWDMYTQNWRTKLARAALLNEKGIGIFLPFDTGNSSFVDFSFVNTH